MVLFEVDIRSAVRAREIEFVPPLDERQWGACWVNLRLGISNALSPCRSFMYRRSDDSFPQSDRLNNDPTSGDTPRVTLPPHQWTSGITYESIRLPHTVVGLVESRTEYSELGVMLPQKGLWIKPGWRGPVVFDLINKAEFDIRLTPVRDCPCRITFFSFRKTSSPCALH
jgi:deoxycytidine triphosphate deaminase